MRGLETTPVARSPLKKATSYRPIVPSEVAENLFGLMSMWCSLEDSHRHLVNMGELLAFEFTSATMSIFHNLGFILSSSQLKPQFSARISKLVIGSQHRLDNWLS